MEIQLTEFENAAFVVFVALLNRAILYYKLNLYTFLTQVRIKQSFIFINPTGMFDFYFWYCFLIKVDENMKRAHERDAVKTQKFYFKLPKLANSNFFQCTTSARPKAERHTSSQLNL